VGGVTQGNAYLRRFLDSRGAVTSGSAEYPNTVILVAQISCMTGNGDLFDLVQGDAQALISSLFDHPTAVFSGRCSLALSAVQ
jgi:hypothetical protein